MGDGIFGLMSLIWGFRFEDNLEEEDDEDEVIPQWGKFA